MVIKSAVVPLGKSPPSWYTPVTPTLLRHVTRRIVDAFQPEQIILFGSQAYGKPTTHSDVDLLVVLNRLRNKSVLERDRRVDQVARSSVATNGILPMDIIVRSPAELGYRLKIGDPFFREVVLKGRVLYERPGTRHRIDAGKWRGHKPQPALVAEWARKAEDDFAVALQFVRPRKRPLPDHVCYYSQ